MKKKNKIIEFIKNNWYFTLLIIPFILFCIRNKTPDNDIWFLMNNGRYVLNNGIPHVDPFTIHEGLHYVMQQWLSSVIFYIVFNMFGKYGLLFFMYIIFILIVIIYYKLCYLLSKNSVLSIVITTIILSFLDVYLVTRPQVFTYIILLLETYSLELYIKKDNWKYLIILPILSILQINLHASMWFMQFVFILPFLVNSLNINGVSIDKIKIKPLLIVMVIMLLSGFINPYGLEAITYIFKSYGDSDINLNIVEMEEATISFFYFKSCVVMLLLLLIYFAKNKNNKIDIRYLLFIIGTFILATKHRKCSVYFILWYGYAISSFLKIKLKNNKLLMVGKRLVIILSIFLLLSLPSLISMNYKNYSMSTSDVEKSVNYIIKNYDPNKVRLFIDFRNGGYSEYYGLKSYIDSRAELFLKTHNGKSDIYSDSVSMSSYSYNFNFKKFIKLYDFTHIIVNYDNGLYKYLEDNKTNYTLEYTEYFDIEHKFATSKLYVRNDISKKYRKEHRSEK